MRNIIYITFFIAFAMQGQTKMTTSQAEALKLMVKEKAKVTQTISSDFVQYKHLDFLDNDIETSGKLAFKSPNLVKWEYVKPFKYEVIFKGDKLYINDEGKKSNVDIGSSKLFTQLNSLIIKSIKGDMFDDNEFAIDYYKNDQNFDVYFSPKDKKFAKFIKTFHITFNDQGDVLEVKMIEPSDDYTRIIFSNRFINKPLADALFTH